MVVCLAAAVGGACGGDSGGDDDCPQPQPCAALGTSCEGDLLVSCRDENDDGCFERSSVDCSVDDGTCFEDMNNAPACTGCAESGVCAGATAGDTLCTGDTLVTCAEVAEGDRCLTPTETDCTANAQVCVTDSGGSECRAADSCDQPACAGLSDGDVACDGGFLNTCDEGADGCLDLTQVNCTPALCDDTGATPVCGTVAQGGDSCGDAIPVLASTFSYVGGNIATDFTDTVTMTGTGCDASLGHDVSDVIFSVALLAGETVHVTETGSALVSRNLQVGSCGTPQACVAGTATMDHVPLTYTASASETVHVIVEPWASFEMGAYEINIAVDPVCGNGAVEAGEECDDGGTADGDGCSSTCTEEYTWQCDGLSPSQCEQADDLGPLSATVDIAEVVVSDAHDDSDWYSFTTTGPVEFQVSASAGSGGDVDIWLYDENGSMGQSAEVGDETTDWYLVRPGIYLVEVEARDPLPGGYTLDIDARAVPEIGPGDDLDQSGGALAQFTSIDVPVTFTQDVHVTGTLSGTGGDLDWSIDNRFHTITDHSDIGDETISSIVPAGTYYMRIAANTNVTAYALDVTVAAAALTDLGSFGAGDPIPATSGGPLAEREYAHYAITFNTPVLLDMVLGGNTTGDTRLAIYDDERRPVFSITAGDEVVSDQPLDVGTYIIQIRSVSVGLGGGPVDGFTFTF